MKRRIYIFLFFKYTWFNYLSSSMRVCSSLHIGLYSKFLADPDSDSQRNSIYSMQKHTFSTKHNNNTSRMLLKHALECMWESRC